MEAEAATDQVTDLTFEQGRDSSLIIHLIGSWRMHHGLPSVGRVLHEVNQTKPRRIGFETSRLGAWDSGLLTFVARTTDLGRSRNIPVVLDGLPEGLVRLVELAEAVPEKKDARVKTQSAPLLQRVGTATINYADGAEDFVTFLGGVVIAIGRMFKGEARFRTSDLMIEIQDCGVKAFGIVAMISFLVGTILAFMGAVQLQQFGAEIYVADLVAIGIVREMGAMMTAIIMAGRTGAAFAAQLGTMKVTQEIDALTTMGISPFQFLLLPRVMALVLMMPLLCLYSDLMGILGGAFVGVGMLDLSFKNYMRETIHALSMTNLLLGVIKATVYGALIAMAGCLRGFQCGNSSSAVGDAATRAVVSSIVLVVVACGLFAFVTNLL